MTRQAAVLVLALCAPGAAAGPWKAAGHLPLGLAGHASAATQGGAFLIAGGSRWEADVKYVVNRVWVRPAARDTWESLATLPHAFAHGGTVVHQNILWLAGGFDASGPSAAVQTLRLDTFAVSLAASLPEPRAYCGAAFLDGALWIVGGTPKDGAFSTLPGHGFRYEIETGKMEPLPAAPAIVNPVVLALDGELHILPGSVWSTERNRLEVPAVAWIYAPAAKRWTQRPLARALPRGLSGVAIDARRAVLVGGAEPRAGVAELSRSAWLYDARDGALAPLPPVPEPRLAASLATDGRFLWLSGGEDRPRSRATAIWRTPVSTFWMP